MVDIFRTAISGMSAAQRQLATTSHNIANVNNPDYSRQRVELSTRDPQFQGGGFVGRGVDAVSVRRVYDNFLTAQVRNHSANQAQLDTLNGLTQQLGALVGDSAAALTPTLNRFFAAAQDLAGDPSSIPARQALLAQGETLSARFQDVDGQMGALRRDVNESLKAETQEINGLARSIAEINRTIANARGRVDNPTANPPNDLLDQRDGLVKQLSEHIAVQTVTQEDGAMSVFIGTGQALVVGFENKNLVVDRSTFDPQDIVIRFEGQSRGTDVSGELIGGRAGGLLSFRRDVLDPAQNSLGLLAVGLAQTFNDQHVKGMDLDGEPGGDFFSVAEPRVLPNLNNSADADDVALAVADAGALTGSDYDLFYDGAAYRIKRLSDGQETVLGGPGSYTHDGMSLTVGGGSPQVNDRFRLQPTRQGGSSFEVALTGPRDIAAASPILAQAALDNQGTAAITPGQVRDPDNPALRNPVRIVFDDPPDTFDLRDLNDPANSRGNVTYRPGEALAVNGWTVELSGTPAAGDTFQVSDNSQGGGDNRNALALAQMQSGLVLQGGRSDYEDVYSQMVAEVGAKGSRFESQLEAETVLLDQAVQARDSVSSVNLDEEAADMLRFQQAYSASAQLVRVADSLFQTMLDAVRR